MPDAAVAVPAAPGAESAGPISAEVAAVQSNDFSSFEAAHAAKRQGKPLDPVQPAAKEPPQLSRKQRDINDRAQRAAETATATLQEENARLKRELDAARVPPPRQEPLSSAAAPPPKGTPDYKRFMAMPDAPKLDDFESVAEHTAAMSVFVNGKMLAEHTARQRHEADRQETKGQRWGGFVDRLQAAKAADPTFADKLSDEAKNLYGVDRGVMNREEIGPRHIVGELVYDSPIPDKVLLHFSEHPDALAALVALPSNLAHLPPGPQRATLHMDQMRLEFARLEGRLESGSIAAAPTSRVESPGRRFATAQLSPVTKAPPPPPTLGRVGSTRSDSEISAAKRGDVSTFLSLRTAKRRAEVSA